MQPLPVITAYAILSGLQKLGHDSDAYTEVIGLPSHDSVDPFLTVPPEIFERLWKLAFEADSRPHLPVLTGFAVPFGAFGLLDYLVGSASTVGEGLQALSRYFRLVSATTHLTVDNSSGWLRVVNEPPKPGDTISDSFTIAVIVSRFKNRTPDSNPLDVRLTRNLGPPLELYKRLFECPVTLDSKTAGIRYSRDLLSQELSGADTVLHKTLRSLAESSEVKNYVSGPVSYAVRLRIPEMIETGNIKAKEMASAMNMSVRTLQRRLSEEGNGFKELVDLFRREEAVRLLNESDKQIGEIARKLGYNEPASFTRAFRRWYGKPPTAWMD